MPVLAAPGRRYAPRSVRGWETRRRMEVLGRRLANPFDSFWERYGPEIPASVEHVEAGHSSVFGDLGADRSAPDEPAWAGLPDADLAYHMAHELAHLLLRGRTYPVAVPGKDEPPGSEAARMAGDLQEMIDHAALTEILGPFGFQNDHIQDRTARGASRGLSSSPVPEPGTAWFATWAIRSATSPRTWDRNDGRRLRPCTRRERRTRRIWANGSSTSSRIEAAAHPARRCGRCWRRGRPWTSTGAASGSSTPKAGSTDRAPSPRRLVKAVSPPTP